MKMLKKYLLLQRVMLLLLILISNSGNMFSANSGLFIGEELEKNQEELENSVDEQIEDLSDPIRPNQKNPVFYNTGAGVTCDFTSRILDHTTSSLNYIKRSSYLLPSLGVKELIYPFHVFL